MTFLSPLMLFGLIGALIPIAVHLRGRRKAKVIPFAALEFLVATDKRLAKFLVLRQVILLVFRVLICLIAALILAQPIATCQSNGPAVSSGPQSAVFIVDNSAASEYLLDDETLLSHSIHSAKALLKQLGPEADVAVLLTTGESQGELTRDHLGLAQTLGEIKGSNDKPQGKRVIASALALLGETSTDRRSIFILAAPTQALFPAGLGIADPSIAVRLISPAEDHDLPNLAISNLGVHADTSMGRGGLRIAAKVVNYGTSERIAKLSLRLGEDIVAQGDLLLAPGETKTKNFSASLGMARRTTAIKVELQDDALMADNTRYAVASARDLISVLLVNGDAHTIRHDDELYYVEAALRPGDRGDSGVFVEQASPDDLGDTPLSRYDVIVLANVSVLSSEKVSALKKWVSNGGGLLIGMGANVDADRYNRDMGPLLAQRLRSPLDLRRGRGTSNQSELQLSKLELEHPIFSVFAKDAPGLTSANFWHIMLLGTSTASKATTSEKHRILARFDNGAAALVEKRRGAGTLMLFASTLDRDWNNLAIHPGFLPLMQQTMRYLASQPLQRVDQQALVGDSISLQVAPTDVRLEVSGPHPLRVVIEGDKVVGRKSARLDSVGEPGIYRVASVDAAGVVLQRPKATFAVNMDPSISNLQLQSAEIIEQGGGSEEGGEVRPTRRIELWHSISALLLLLLLLESAMGVMGKRKAVGKR